MTKPHNSRRHRAATAALVSTTLAAAFGSAGVLATPASASTPASAHVAAAISHAAAKARVKVIVLMKNQHSNVPASATHVAQRESLIASDQDALLATLRAQGITGLHSFTTLNGFAATMTAAQATQLAKDARVAAVVPDTKQAAAAPNLAASPGAASSAKGLATPHVVPPAGPQNTALCGTGTKPNLEPEALSTTHDLTTDGTPNAQQLATGKGVTVAVLADGVDASDPDLIRNGKSIVSYVDLTGDPADPEYGAEGMGDASAIAAQGNAVYDISQYNNPVTSPVKAGCDIKVVGMAPGANIIAINSTFYTSNLVEGVDYAVTHGANVLNESFGGNPTPDSGSMDAIQIANDAAVAAGLVVTVSSGDAGTTGTNGSPSTDPNVIAVGASTDSRIYQQTGYAGAAAFSTNGQWTDNNISSLSSGGVSDGGKVPDLVAPGEADWALCSTNVDASPECASLYGGQQNGIQPFGGTSQSAPLTAGAAALVIQAYRSSHGGATPSPALTKKIITSSASDLGVPAFEQGAGLLNARAAVELARSVPAESGASGPTSSVGSNLLITPGQVDITGVPGTTQTVPVTVTNVGSSPQTVVAGSRTFTPQSDQTQTVALNSTTDTPYTYVTGAQWVSHKVTFTVPAGADRLQLQGAWQGAPQVSGTGPTATTVTPVVRFTLIDPSGAYAANSRPQGGASSANYANLDVRRPAAGTWTAVLYTPAGSKGYTGPVLLDTSTQQATPADSVTPTGSTLAPGASETVSARVVVPNTGGDTTESITLSGSGGATSSVPVVLRTLIPVSRGEGSFSGTITGGNARAQSPTQSNTWAFDVTDRNPSASVDLTLSKDPNVLLEGALVGPTGEVVAVGTNQSPSTGALVKGLHVSEADPAPGRYRFILVVENPVSGAEISQGFTASLSLKKTPVFADLPQGEKIKKGATKTVQVLVTNPGSTAIGVQLDPRSTESGTLDLTPIGGSATTALPAGATPEYLVPPTTTSLTLAAVSSVDGSQVELEGPLLAPDLLGSRGGSTSVATDTAPEVGNGLWLTGVTEVLKPGATVLNGTTTATASAQTQLFDTTVDSTTGDPWLQAVQATPTGNSADGGKPVIIGPGRSKLITVTITPTAPKGTKVSGVLHVVTFGFAGPYLGVLPFIADSTLASLPYSYRVG